MKLLPLTALIALAIASSALAQEGLKDRIRDLESKASEAKAAGRMDEAEKMLNGARVLAARASAEDEKREGDRPQKPNRDELRAMLEKTRQQLEEAARDGKQEEAVELKHRVARLESALREDKGSEGEYAGKKGRPEGPGAGSPKDRLHHLMQAIEHLRAAGMNEPAERLNEQAQEMKRQLSHASEAKGRDGEKHSEGDRQTAELHEGMMKLQRQMQELQKRLEEMSRDRR